MLALELPYVAIQSLPPLLILFFLIRINPIDMLYLLLLDLVLRIG